MPDPSWVSTGAGSDLGNGNWTVAGTHEGKDYYTNASGWHLFWIPAGPPGAPCWGIGPNLVTGPAYRGATSQELPANSWSAVSPEDEPAPTVTAYGGGGGAAQISGLITADASPLAGVIVTLSGDASGEDTSTEAAGDNYWLTNLGNGNYVVTPWKNGWNFTPDHRDVEIAGGASVGDQDFAASAGSSSSSSSSGSTSSSSSSNSSSSFSSSSSESISSSSSSQSSSSSSFSSSSSSFSSSSSCSSSSSFSSSSSSSNSEPYRYYTYALPTLSSVAGTVVETRVKVTHSEGAVNQGACISLFDGTHQFTAWLRENGVNLDGAADVPADMTYFRIVRLEAQGGYCHLYLDGVWQQGAVYMNITTEKKAVFGTWVRL